MHDRRIFFAALAGWGLALVLTTRGPEFVSGVPVLKVAALGLVKGAWLAIVLLFRWEVERRIRLVGWLSRMSESFVIAWGFTIFCALLFAPIVFDAISGAAILGAGLAGATSSQSTTILGLLVYCPYLMAWYGTPQVKMGAASSIARDGLA